MQTSNNCQCVCIPSFSSENIFCHRISVQQTAVYCPVFPALKILTFSSLYNHDNWPLQSFVDLYNYIFNVIIVFLNKITNHTVPIFYQMKITHQFCIDLFGISLYTISQTGASSHWKQMANENLKTMFLIMSICFQFGESLKLVNT